MHQALNDRLDDAISQLTDSLAPLPETRIEREALALQKLNVFCLADDANWRTQSAWWQSCVATDSLAPLPEPRFEREALALLKLNVFCLAVDDNWRSQSAWWQSCVATVTYIYSTLNRYDPTSLADSQAIIEFRQKLASEIKKLQHAVAEGQ